MLPRRHPVLAALFAFAALTAPLVAAPGAARADSSLPGTRPPPPAAAGYPLAGHQLVLPGPIYFKTNSDELLPQAEPSLRHVLGFLAARGDVTALRIEVHSDARGAAAYNLRLSQARALSVARWLVARGVDCHRLVPVGFGQTRPIVDNRTEEGRQKNRRTDFFIAALRGQPVGGQPLDLGGGAGDPCRSPKDSPLIPAR